MKRHLSGRAYKSAPRTHSAFLLHLCRIAAATAILGFACGCGSEPTESQAHTADNFLAQKAKESGGDFNKLSPADQKRVQELTQGHGPQALRGMAPKTQAPQ
jgi:hypothetical protein